MRTRLATIAALSLAAVIGTAAAAQAAPPKGPGGIDSKPTTTTTAPPKPNPKGPDKVSPTPTTQPPKGPGDIAQPQPDNDPKPPKGPGDIAQPQPDPVVDPAPPQDPKGPQDKAPVPPKNDGGNKGDSGNGNTTQGDDEAGVGWDQPDVNPDGTLVNGKSVETIPVANSEAPAANDDTSTEAAADAESEGGLSPFVLLGFAVLTAGLIAFVVARRRGEEQDAEQL